MDVAILLFDKINFKIKKKLTSNKNGHFIIIRTIYQDDITLTYIYVLILRAPKL